MTSLDAQRRIHLLQAQLADACSMLIVDTGESVRAELTDVLYRLERLIDAMREPLPQ